MLKIRIYNFLNFNFPIKGHIFRNSINIYDIYFANLKLFNYYNLKLL